MWAKKSLGQNFLKNLKVAEAVASAIKVTKDDTVLEIGPGRGMLTEVLLRKAKKVIAVEKDHDLIPVLDEKFKSEISKQQFILLEGDILDNKIQEKIFKDIKGHYKICANIPYFITGLLLRQFLTFERQPEAISLLVQKEVAERVVAKDGKESILSISVKAYGSPTYIQTVRRGNFSPAPKVDSAILAISNISRDFFKHFREDEFFNIVKAGFLHKRKFVKKNLETAAVKQNLDLKKIPDKARAEDLSLSDWKEILM